MKQLLSVLIISVILIGCKGGGKPIATKLKLVAFEQLPEDEPGVLSTEVSNLFFPVLCDCKEQSPIVFDSHIIRVDTAGTQEVFNHQKVAQFAGDKSKISFWKNKAKSLNNLALTQGLLLPKNEKNVLVKLDKYLSDKTKNDSIYVLLETNSVVKNYSVGNKTYHTFNNLDSLKTEIVKVLGKNSNVNFTVLYNPPASEIVSQEREDIIIEEPRKKKSSARVATSSIRTIKQTKTERTISKEVVVDETSSGAQNAKKKKWTGDKRTMSEVKNGTISEKEVKE